MSAAAEAPDLADFDLDESPPCEMRYVVRNNGEETIIPCGQPSVLRVRFTCECGDTAFRFMCAVHLTWLKENRVRCRSCLTWAGTGGFTWAIV